MRFLEFFKSRYVLSLEQRVEELKTEKRELQQRIRELEGCIIPSLRAIEREKVQAAAVVPMNREQFKAKVAEAAGDKPKVERMPPVTGWIQARDRVEHLSQQ